MLKIRPNIIKSCLNSYFSWSIHDKQLVFEEKGKYERRLRELLNGGIKMLNCFLFLVETFGDSHKNR